MSTMSSPEQRLAALPHARAVAQNGDVSIHYDTYGAGPALLFLHGFPDTALTWIEQILDFARDHLVIVPTLRGYPPSSVPLDDDAYQIPVLAEDVSAVLDDLGLETAVIVGHDWGGVVLQAFALIHPDRVEGMVLLNSTVLQNFVNLVHTDPEQQEISRYTHAYTAYDEGDDKNIDFVVRNIRDPEWRREVADYLERSPLTGMLRYYKVAYPNPPYAEQTGDQSFFVYRVPTLIVWGLDDEYFSRKSLNDLWDWFTESYRFVSVPGAGHWVFRDEPETVNREIRSWLTSRPTKQKEQQ
jgi:pimeloyl-ACP methyl ester carboxylesterase